MSVNVGGSDRQQVRLVVFPAQPDLVTHPYEQLVNVLAYVARVADAAAYTVIVDMRTGWQKHLRLVLRAIAHVLTNKIARYHD
jgi:2-methylisocitrate lyase-like PEP mutase family enzyme